MKGAVRAAPAPAERRCGDLGSQQSLLRSPLCASPPVGWGISCLPSDEQGSGAFWLRWTNVGHRLSFSISKIQ